MKAVLALVGAVLLVGGCRSGGLVRVAAVDGSGDHRVFAIGTLTQVMMEPVFWTLEDTEKINFDLPVTLYFKDALPPEYEHVTMRMLHDGWDGLSRRESFALMMMAVCDELETTPQELCERYLVEPYGLVDTSFVMTDALRARLIPPCGRGLFDWLGDGEPEVAANRMVDAERFSEGLYSSAYDVLRVAYVIRPHLDRMKAVLDEDTLDDGRKALYRRAAPSGGGIIGFDSGGRHSVVVLDNANGPGVGDALKLLPR